ncbi:MAG: hypothetical protein ACKESB_01345 [Candidatus Hodgkinia cicadicola]
MIGCVSEKSNVMVAAHGFVSGAFGGVGLAVSRNVGWEMGEGGGGGRVRCEGANWQA